MQEKTDNDPCIVDTKHNYPNSETCSPLLPASRMIPCQKQSRASDLSQVHLPNRGTGTPQHDIMMKRTSKSTALYACCKFSECCSQKETQRVFSSNPKEYKRYQSSKYRGGLDDKTFTKHISFAKRCRVLHNEQKLD